MLAASAQHLVGCLLLLSYPLHPPERPAELRTKHFPALQTPALFVHGTRDGFGTLTEMESALSEIPAQTELLSVPSVGHELIPRRNREEFSAEVVSRFLSFLNTIG
jgi:predicted alpha/beta-hydrolase family hydrolase